MFCPDHPICLYVDGDNCLGDVYHLLHAESDAGESDDALEFLVDFVCHETDADVRFYPSFRKVKHGAHLQIALADPEELMRSFT